MVRRATVQARGFNCANCGAAVELRALTHTAAVTCTSCGALLDARDHTLIVLQQAKLRQHITPKIPLGTRGTWHGHPFAVVGFQRRGIEVDGEFYSWDEYVLFNPYQGFRYLTEYQGHWNDVRTVRDLPHMSGPSDTGPSWGGRAFRHFQGATASTHFVLGEFPWRVTLGDAVRTTDYISPPYMLSSETTADEETWSIGEYVDGARIWESFRLPGSPPPAIGVYANQPSPYLGQPARYWTVFAALAGLLLLLFIWREASASREEVFAGDYRFVKTAAEAEPAFVTQPFRIPESGTVELSLATTLNNAWAAFDLALINLESGEALNVSREVSYYSGVDSDGSWSEGDQSERVRLPPVPPGEYYLRVEPEAAPELPEFSYHLAIRRDVPQELPYGIAFLLLLVPPIVVTVRKLSFESTRWQESDHGE